MGRLDVLRRWDADDDGRISRNERNAAADAFSGSDLSTQALMWVSDAHTNGATFAPLGGGGSSGSSTSTPSGSTSSGERTITSGSGSGSSSSTSGSSDATADPSPQPSPPSDGSSPSSPPTTTQKPAANGAFTISSVADLERRTNALRFPSGFEAAVRERLAAGAASVSVTVQDGASYEITTIAGLSSTSSESSGSTPSSGDAPITQPGGTPTDDGSAPMQPPDESGPAESSAGGGVGARQIALVLALVAGVAAAAGGVGS